MLYHTSRHLVRYFLFCFAFFFTHIAFAATEVKTKGGLHVSDDPYAFSIKALAQFDDAWYSGSAYDKQGQFPNGGAIHRIYLYFNGTVAKNWSFNFNTCTELADFTLPVDLTMLIGEAHLNYDGFKNTHLQFGQVPIPSSLENWSYYSDDFFITVSSPVGAFFPVFDYGIGIFVDHTIADTFLLQGALFQPPAYIFFDGQVGLGKSDRLNQALRFVASPIHKETCTVHFGIWSRRQSYYYSFMGSPAPLDFVFQGYNNTPEMDGRVTGSLVNTGPIRNKSSWLSGVEFASVYGPFMIQAEYMGVRVKQVFSNTESGTFLDPESLDEFTVTAPPLNTALWFYGWYVEGAYVLTGESHPYEFESGLFHRPSPQCWYGAWEIVARYSSVNLSNKNIFGGKEYNISLGLNWYINDIVRIYADYVHIRAHPTLNDLFFIDNSRKRKLDVFGLRFQIDF